MGIPFLDHTVFKNLENSYIWHCYNQLFQINELFLCFIQLKMFPPIPYH